MKSKQSVFTEVETKYLLLHTSGESVVLSGSGHGVDAQDKGAGKATTYALKYTLLYTFLVPTGKIDDADTTHSDDIKTPDKAPKFVSTTHDKPWLNKFEADKVTPTEAWIKATELVGKGEVTIAKIEEKYKLSQALKSELVQIQSVGV